MGSFYAKGVSEGRVGEGESGRGGDAEAGEGRPGEGERGHPEPLAFFWLPLSPSTSPPDQPPQPLHQPADALGGGVLAEGAVGDAEGALVIDAEGVARDDRDAELADEALDQVQRIEP